MIPDAPGVAVPSDGRRAAAGDTCSGLCLPEASQLKSRGGVLTHGGCFAALTSPGADVTLIRPLAAKSRITSDARERSDSAVSYRLDSESTMRPAILSVAKMLGARSETWLYRQITCTPRHRVHVLAYKYLNRREYPHEPVTLVPWRETSSYRAAKLAAFLRGAGRPVFDFRQCKVLVRLLADPSLKVVQAHFAGVACQVREALSEAGRPFLAWFYGSDLFRLTGDSEAQVSRLAKSDSIFCCTSEALRLRAIELGCPSDRVHLHYLGVPVPTEVPERSPCSRLQVVSVGRLIDFKDPVGLVRVAAALKRRGVAFEWRHFGDGKLRPQVEEAVEESGLAGSVCLMGSCPQESVLEGLRRADVMVHNAVIAPDGGRESFGVALAEAAGQGLPIVSAPVGGIPEIVVDRRTGFLVDNGSAEEMAERVDLLWKDPDLRASMGRAAHERAMALFEADRQAEKLDCFYDSLVKSDG